MEMPPVSTHLLKFREAIQWLAGWTLGLPQVVPQEGQSGGTNTELGGFGGCGESLRRSLGPSLEK